MKRRTNIVKNTEEELFDLLLQYGKKSGTEYTLPVGGKVIVDGRIADEYEDLKTPAPCRVDSIKADSNSSSCSFHMHTAFTTAYPLMSNDWYNFSCIPQTAQKEVLSFIKEYVKKMKPNADYHKEMNRQKWLALVKEHGRIWPTFDKRNSDYKECDIMHSVDCCFCCHTDNNDIDAKIKTYEDLLNFNTAVMLRMQYRTAATFASSTYLSTQDYKRQFNFYIWVNKIYPKVIELCPDNILDYIISCSPDDLLQSKSKFVFKPIDFASIKAEQTVNTRNIDFVPKASYTVEESKIMPTICNEFVQCNELYIIEHYINEKLNTASVVRILKNKYKTPNYVMTLSEHNDTWRGFEFDIEKYKSDKGFGYAKSLLTYEDINSKQISTIEYSGRCFRPSNYHLLKAVPGYEYEKIASDSGMVFKMDEMYAKTYDVNNENIQKIWECDFNIEKAKLILKASKSRPETIMVDGVKWTTTNIISNFEGKNLICYKRGYDLEKYIPYGYRLPTYKEMYSLVEKHPFSRYEEPKEKKRKTKNDEEKDPTIYWVNDIGMKVKSIDRICGAGWARSNYQPVCWLSFDEPLNPKNPIFCPYYNFIRLINHAQTTIETQYSLSGNGAHLLLVKMTDEEIQSKIKWAKEIVKNNKISIEKIYNQFGICDIDNIKCVNFKIKSMNCSEVNHVYDFSKSNSKTFDSVRKALSEFLGIKIDKDNIVDIVLKTNDGEKIHANQYQYNVSIDYIIPFLLMLIQNKNAAQELGYFGEHINKHSNYGGNYIKYANAETFFLMKDFLSTIGIYPDMYSYTYSYSNSHNKHKGTGFICDNFEIELISGEKKVIEPNESLVNATKQLENYIIDTFEFKTEHQKDMYDLYKKTGSCYREKSKKK